MSTQEPGPTKQTSPEDSSRHFIVRMRRHVWAESEIELYRAKVRQAVSRRADERDFVSFLMVHMRISRQTSESLNRGMSQIHVTRLGSSVVIWDAVAQLEGLKKRQDSLEALMYHGIQPTLSKMARLVEGAPQKDALPAASSAQYELRAKVKDSLDTLNAILDIFEDPRERLSLYTLLQQQFRELVRLSRSTASGHYRNAVITIHDVIHGIYSEDLTVEQVQAIRESTEKLATVNWEREEVRSLDKELRNAGLETIPSDRFKYAHNV